MLKYLGTNPPHIIFPTDPLDKMPLYIYVHLRRIRKDTRKLWVIPLFEIWVIKKRFTVVEAGQSTKAWWWFLWERILASSCWLYKNNAECKKATIHWFIIVCYYKFNQSCKCYNCSRHRCMHILTNGRLSSYSNHKMRHVYANLRILLTPSMYVSY